MSIKPDITLSERTWQCLLISSLTGFVGVLFLGRRPVLPGNCLSLFSLSPDLLPISLLWACVLSHFALYFVL